MIKSQLGQTVDLTRKRDQFARVTGFWRTENINNILGFLQREKSGKQAREKCTSYDGFESNYTWQNQGMDFIARNYNGNF